MDEKRGKGHHHRRAAAVEGRGRGTSGDGDDDGDQSQTRHTRIFIAGGSIPRREGNGKRDKSLLLLVAASYILSPAVFDSRPRERVTDNELEPPDLWTAATAWASSRSDGRGERVEGTRHSPTK